MDKISIIIPVYNGEKYLNRCIEFLLNQSYQNIEYIFINDGSSDNTYSILEKYAKADSRIVIIDKKNTGVSDSRNMGIMKATGDYVCFCDCDDIYDKDFVKIMHETIVNKNVDVVRCNFNVISEDSKIIDCGKVDEFLYDKKHISSSLIPLILNGTIPCFTYLLMIKREKLNFKFPTDVAMMEDVVFYLEMLFSISSIYVMPSKLYTIMFNLTGATNNSNNYKRNIKDVLKVNKYIKDILESHDSLLPEYIQAINSNNLMAISDFIFKHYIYTNEDTILMVKNVAKQINVITKETDLSSINIQRKIILKLILNNRYFLLKIYFKFRKLIFDLRRR